MTFFLTIYGDFEVVQLFFVAFERTTDMMGVLELRKQWKRESCTCFQFLERGIVANHCL